MLNTFQTQETGNQTETVKLKTRSLHFNFTFQKINGAVKDWVVIVMVLEGREGPLF